MSKQNKTRPGKAQDSKEKSLPLSIIIPLADDPEKLNLCLESLQKIRKPFEKDYEVILPVKDESQASKVITSRDGGSTLLEKGIMRILEVGDEANAEKAIRTGIESSSHENTLIFEPDNIERSFNFDEFFNIPEKSLEKKNIILPLFRGQEPGGGTDHSPMLLLRKSFAGYILYLDTRTGSNHDYQSPLFYYLSQLNIKPGRHVISQVNPFAAAVKTAGRFPANIPAGLNNFTDWYFRIPRREIKTSPHKKFSFLDIPSYFRSLFVVTAILIAIILPIMSLGAGQSGDDEKHYRHAEKVYNYFVD